MRASFRDLKPVVLVVFFTAACASSGADDGDIDPNPGDGTDASFRCGNGIAEQEEDCDENDLAGSSCESLGFSGGTLACDLLTCRYDVSECIATQTLTNDNGVCNRNLTCNGGNPQNMVECFANATLPPPFHLTQVSYTIGPSPGAPNSLNVEVYQWAGTGPPGALASTVAVGAADRTVGAHTVNLVTPVELATPSFCIGLGATTLNDGYSIGFSDSSIVAGASWVQAPACNLNVFTDTASAANLVMGNWCIRATVEKLPAQL